MDHESQTDFELLHQHWGSLGVSQCGMRAHVQLCVVRHRAAALNAHVADGDTSSTALAQAIQDLHEIDGASTAAAARLAALSTISLDVWYHSHSC